MVGRHLPLSWVYQAYLYAHVEKHCGGEKDRRPMIASLPLLIAIMLCNHELQYGQGYSCKIKVQEIVDGGVLNA